MLCHCVTIYSLTHTDGSEEFKEAVTKLANLLGIQPHPTDARVTFRALAKYAEKYLAVNETLQEPGKQGKVTPLQDVDLGFDLKGQIMVIFHSFL